MRLDQRNRSLGDVKLENALFKPELITTKGIEPYFRGLANQIPQEVDGYIIDSVRNFTIGNNSSGFDLGALNIQRGRDHGLPGYNQVRIDFGLAPKATFAEMTSNLEMQARLASAYTSPDDVDVSGGRHCERIMSTAALWGKHSPRSSRTSSSALAMATASGMRHTSILLPLALVQQQTLGIIIKRNTTIGNQMQDEVFHVPQGP